MELVGNKYIKLKHTLGDYYELEKNIKRTNDAGRFWNE